jgi:ABC-2 type transport system ATP-binding protein
VLRVRGLKKRYGDVVALDGVDLDIAEGQITGLLGPNGAGKTTLVSIVAGLRRADVGEVAVAGVDVLADPVGARRLLGLAPQDLGIYPVLTVRENLIFFGELVDLRGPRLAARIDEVAEALELTELMSRLARTLSGGEQRRLHTALAMLHQPRLLMLDEPTTGVDVRTRGRLLEAVRALAAEGTSICYSTHYLAEVEALGASAAILDRGRVLAAGRVDELVRQYGECAVDVTFDGEPPSVDLGRRTSVADGVLRVFTDDPPAEAAAVLAGLGPHARRVRSIDLVMPSLEAVFLAVTGRRYRDDESEEEPIGVAQP